MSTRVSTPASDEVVDIIATLDRTRANKLFTGNSLIGLHEPIVQALTGPAWTLKRAYEQRAVFIQSFRPHTHVSDDYRRLFMAMAEAGHAQGVLGMIHATGRKDRCFAGNQPLISMGTLTAMVSYDSTLIAPVVHFLSRAATSMLPEEPSALLKALIKGFDPESLYAGRWLEAIQRQVSVRSLETLGMRGEMSQAPYWVAQLLIAKTPEQTAVASAVVAGMISKKELSVDDITGLNLDTGQKMRLVKGLGLSQESVGFKRVISSRNHSIEPSYQL